MLKHKWLCHHKGDIFSDGIKQGGRGVVTTGFGMSGVPHVGTTCQILGAILMQQAGLDVQIVLGDLDAYNARGCSLSRVEDLVGKYSEFILNLGFDSSIGVLRTQKDYKDVLLTAYLIANCLTDDDFQQAEEDISQLYIQEGVYNGIEFPVKQSILLMVADFIDLTKIYDNVLIMLGLDEHRYVGIADKVTERQSVQGSIGAIYSRVTKGLSGYPKMSKSLPGSSLNVDMKSDEIFNLILFHEGEFDSPLESPVFQMMCQASYYSPSELDEIFFICKEGGVGWSKKKTEYSEVLIDIFRRWPK